MGAGTHAEMLWRVNSEYVQRLSQAYLCVDLLQQLVDARGGDDALRGCLADARVSLSALNDEHRTWRHTYFYESVETRRMVQTERQIIHALRHFDQMRLRHARAVRALYVGLCSVPRPDPYITHVAPGDLWDKLQYALIDLLDFIGADEAEVQQ